MNSSRTWATTSIVALALGLGIASATDAWAADPSGSVTGTSIDSCSIEGDLSPDGQYLPPIQFEASETHTYTFGPRVNIGSHLLGAQVSLTGLTVTLPPEAVNALKARGFTTGNITFAEENNDRVFEQMRGSVNIPFDVSQSSEMHVSGLNGVVEFGSWSMNESGRHEETYPVTLQRIGSVLTLDNGKNDFQHLDCSPKRLNPSTSSPAPTSATSGPAAPASPTSTPPTTAADNPSAPSSAGQVSGATPTTRKPSGSPYPLPTQASTPSSRTTEGDAGPRVETDQVTHDGQLSSELVLASVISMLGATGLIVRRRRRS